MDFIGFDQFLFVTQLPCKLFVQLCDLISQIFCVLLYLVTCLCNIKHVHHSPIIFSCLAINLFDF